MRIRTKLLLSLLLLVGIILGINIIFQVLSRSSEHEVLQLSKGALAETIHAAKMNKALSNSQAALQELLKEYFRLAAAIDTEAKSAAKAGIKTAEGLIDDSLAQLKAAFAKTREATRVQVELAGQFGDEALEATEKLEIEQWHGHMELAIKRYETMLDGLIETAGASPVRASEMLENVIEPFLRNELLSKLEEYRTDSENELAEEIESLLANIRFSKHVLLVALLASGCIAIFLNVYLSRKISRPLALMSNALTNITKGEFPVPDAINPKDEFGRLAAVLAGMTETIRRQTMELETARDELENQNAHLQQRVAEQTYKLMENNELLQREIIERKIIEKQIQASLNEKEVLLKEIHHRVKNNLQIISSLLSLQAEKVDSEAIASAIIESQLRVKTMAIIHEKLYGSEDLSRIRFGAYIESLVGFLKSIYSGHKRTISFELNLENLALSIEHALPCGLIINELATNAYKHAFGPEGGVIRIGLLETADRMITLSISDNGSGLPSGLDLVNPATLGLQLVAELVEQIDGRLSLADNGGAQFTISFSV